MGMVGATIIIIVGLSIFFATKSDEQINSGMSPIPVDEKLACSIDSDCVPAGCCHASSVVNKNFAPDCSGMFCTAVCEPDTLDCGQGKPKCIVGRCEIVKTGVKY